MYLIPGGLNDAEWEFCEAGDGGRDADDVDEQDQSEDETNMAAKENACKWIQKYIIASS